MKDKLYILIRPYLLAHILLLVGYTSLIWLLSEKLGLINIDNRSTNTVVSIVLPMLIAGLIAWVYLRRRLTILKLESTKGKDWKDFYTVIAWFSLIIPVIIAQMYLQTAAGKLTPLENIHEVFEKPATKYYTVKNAMIDDKNVGIYLTSEVSGKRRQYLDIKLYVTLPIYDKAADTITHTPPVWLGIKYTKSIDNKKDGETKDKLCKAFIQKCEDSFYKTDFTKLTYLTRINGNPDKGNFFESIKRNPIYNHNANIVLSPSFTPFSERNGNKLAYIFMALLIGIFVWVTMVLCTKTVPHRLQEFKERKTTRQIEREKEEIKEILMPRGDYFITPILAYLIIIIYILLALRYGSFQNIHGVVLYYWGANVPSLSLHTEPWRLLTNIFLQGSIMHVAGNVYGIIFTGLLLEKLTGRLLLILLFLSTGILASLISSLWHQDVPFMSVGASGAVFGLIGIIIAFSITKVVDNGLKGFYLVNTFIFAVVNLVIGLLPGIDNTAHIGGLVSGFIIGLMISKYIRNRNRAADDNQIDNLIDN